MKSRWADNRGIKEKGWRGKGRVTSVFVCHGMEKINLKRFSKSFLHFWGSHFSVQLMTETSDINEMPEPCWHSYPRSVPPGCCGVAIATININSTQPRYILSDIAIWSNHGNCSANFK